MSDEAVMAKVERFQRTVAKCLSVLPFLFAAQCFFASIAAPVFKDMYVDFGSKLPGLTAFVLKSWLIWAAIAVAVPIAGVVVARQRGSSTSVVFSTAAAVLMFVLAQFVTLALFLPIWQLGAVAGGMQK